MLKFKILGISTERRINGFTTIIFKEINTEEEWKIKVQNGLSKKLIKLEMTKVYEEKTSALNHLTVGEIL